LTFGPDGHLYVASIWDNVGRFNVSTGELIDEFVTTGSGGLDFAWDLVFGTDGNGDGIPELLVSSFRTGDVLRYDGATGTFIDEFVAVGEGGLDGANAMTFGPDGSFYVTGNNGVLRFHTPLQNIYKVTLAEGDLLNLATSTPLGGLNGLDPMINFYDSFETLVAFDDNSAADGRNAALSYVVPVGGAGTYFIEIIAVDPAGGEYVLTIDVTTPPPGPGITVIPTAGLVTGEDGTTAQFSVVLDTQPTADVSIGISSSDTLGGMVDKASLTFTSTNWNTSQTVTVTGVDDPDVDGDIAYTILTDPATGAAEYVGIDAADVSVTNQDNDAAGNANDMYVWDIVFDTRCGARGVPSTMSASSSPSAVIRTQTGWPRAATPSSPERPSPWSSQVRPAGLSPAPPTRTACSLRAGSPTSPTAPTRLR
jgi:hypothetical protein